MRQYGYYLYFTSEARRDRLAPGHMGFYVAELGSEQLQSGSGLHSATAAHVMRSLEAGGPGWV